MSTVLLQMCLKAFISWGWTLHESILSDFENTIFGMVNIFALGWGCLFTMPALACLKRRGVQVKSDRWSLGRISHLVVPNIVRNVGQLALAIINLRDAIQLAIVSILPNASLQNLEPAPITGMVVDWWFLVRIPAQQEECVGFVVRRNQVPCVWFVAIKERVLLPNMRRKLGSSKQSRNGVIEGTWFDICCLSQLDSSRNSIYKVLYISDLSVTFIGSRWSVERREW